LVLVEIELLSKFQFQELIDWDDILLKSLNWTHKGAHPVFKLELNCGFGFGETKMVDVAIPEHPLLFPKIVYVLVLDGVKMIWLLLLPLLHV